MHSAGWLYGIKCQEQERFQEQPPKLLLYIILGIRSRILKWIFFCSDSEDNHFPNIVKYLTAEWSCYYQIPQ